MRTVRRSRRSVVLVVALAGAACAAPDTPSAAPETEAEVEVEVAQVERDAVLAALQAVFDALERADAELLREVLDPDIRMVFVETGADGTVRTGTSTLEELVARIEGAEAPLIERMWSPVVQVKGRIANVWAPYDFYVGQRFSHCGIDVATLMKVDGAWRIVALSWSRAQPPACALHPDGPPGA